MHPSFYADISQSLLLFWTELRIFRTAVEMCEVVAGAAGAAAAAAAKEGVRKGRCHMLHTRWHETPMPKRSSMLC